MLTTSATLAAEHLVPPVGGGLVWCGVVPEEGRGMWVVQVCRLWGSSWIKKVTKTYITSLLTINFLINIMLVADWSKYLYQARESRPVFFEFSARLGY